MVTAAVTAAAPSIAAAFDAQNADKVDGKHAVGAGASSQKRAGKLVATKSNGKLPNNIIAKAPAAKSADMSADSQKLDGIDSTGFVKGSGSEYKTGTTVVATNASATNILTFPGLALQGTCAGDLPAVTLNLAEDWSEAYTVSNGGTPVVQNATAASIVMPGSDPHHTVFHLAWRGSGLLGGTRVVTIEVFAQENGAGDCKFSATGMDRGTGTFFLEL